MNTKTMRLPPRRISTTNASNNTSKHKEKESGLDALHQPTTKKLKLTPAQLGSPKPKAESAFSGPSSQLLAGYLAHEFLTKGTLLGQPWDSACAESPTLPVVACGGGDVNNRGEAEPELRAKPKFENLERYVEVADLLKVDGAHLAGIVNPTQLARVLQL